MNEMPMATSLGTTLMMVAMMLPSFAPTLWAYHGHLRATGVARPSRLAAVFAAGYACVWGTISLVLATPAASQVAHPSSWIVSTLLVCVGVVQWSQWKARRLVRCRRAWVGGLDIPSSSMVAWRQGIRFGVDCALSCAGPMAVLCVVGLMDLRMMLLITTAITAERVAPAGARVARFTGLVALTIGLL